MNVCELANGNDVMSLMRCDGFNCNCTNKRATTGLRIFIYIYIHAQISNAYGRTLRVFL